MKRRMKQILLDARFRIPRMLPVIVCLSLVVVPPVQAKKSGTSKSITVTSTSSGVGGPATIVIRGRSANGSTSIQANIAVTIPNGASPAAKAAAIRTALINATRSTTAVPPGTGELVGQATVAAATGATDPTITVTRVNRGLIREIIVKGDGMKGQGDRIDSLAVGVDDFTGDRGVISFLEGFSASGTDLTGSVGFIEFAAGGQMIRIDTVAGMSPSFLEDSIVSEFVTLGIDAAIATQGQLSELDLDFLTDGRVVMIKGLDATGISFEVQDTGLGLDLAGLITIIPEPATLSLFTFSGLLIASRPQRR